MTALPRPLVDDGTVRNDPAERDLVVRPARDARGLTKVLWRDGVAAIAKDDGQLGGPPTVWADAVLDGRRVGRVSYARAEGNELRFKFRPGHPQYKKLLTTPGLRARIVVDRASGHVLGVTFVGRRTGG